jgi:hypothetical protein
MAALRERRAKILISYILVFQRSAKMIMIVASPRSQVHVGAWYRFLALPGWPLPSPRAFLWQMIMEKSKDPIGRGENFLATILQTPSFLKSCDVA